jgi:hypothetical protein
MSELLRNPTNNIAINNPIEITDDMLTKMKHFIELQDTVNNSSSSIQNKANAQGKLDKIRESMKKTNNAKNSARNAARNADNLQSGIISSTFFNPNNGQPVANAQRVAANNSGQLVANNSGQSVANSVVPSFGGKPKPKSKSSSKKPKAKKPKTKAKKAPKKK